MSSPTAPTEISGAAKGKNCTSAVTLRKKISESASRSNSRGLSRHVRYSRHPCLNPMTTLRPSPIFGEGPAQCHWHNPTDSCDGRLYGERTLKIPPATIVFVHALPQHKLNQQRIGASSPSVLHWLRWRHFYWSRFRWSFLKGVGPGRGLSTKGETHRSSPRKMEPFFRVRKSIELRKVSSRTHPATCL